MSRFALLGCCAALVAAAYAIDTRFEAAMIRAHVQLGSTIALAQANTALIADGPHDARLLESRERTLAETGVQADRAAIVAQVVRDAARLAGRYHTRVTDISERNAPPAPSIATHPVPSTAGATGGIPFEAIPFDLTLTGTYRDLIATVAALARESVPMQVEIAAIEATGTRDAPPLTAHVHLSVERLASNELPHA